MLVKLEISNVRNIEFTEIALDPGINLFLGNNGSGKSSVLESAYLLSRGRSFRTKKIKKLVSAREVGLVVRGEFSGSTFRHVTVAFDGKTKRVSLDNSTETSLTLLSRNLRMRMFHEGSFRLLIGEPFVRRNFVDWLVFETDPLFRHVVKDFITAKENVNFLLRHKNIAEVDAWLPLFSKSGERLGELRNDYLVSLMNLFSEISKGFDFLKNITLVYSKGWSKSSTLYEDMIERLPTSMNLGYSLVGPQRGDFGFRQDSSNIGETLSRGQQKVFIVLLYLTSLLHNIEKSPSSTLLAVDDVSAELDKRNLSALIAVIAEHGVQTMLSSTDSEISHASLGSSSQVFHVEHGRVS